MLRTETGRNSSSSRDMLRQAPKPRPRPPHQGGLLRLRGQRPSSQPTKRFGLGLPTARRHKHHLRPTTLRSASLPGLRSRNLTPTPTPTRRVSSVVTLTEHPGSKASTPTCLDLTRVWHLTASMYIVTSRRTLVVQAPLHRLHRGHHGPAHH
jgi:hypothetical protein